ncbi:RHS repeat-associated protein [Leifsonia sp. AK011]|uniref:RHS repeat-associated core domain-containing protein n=1 Tax=Leifsonia sp. AK011 TaxID=2723075 RepID=UPI0015C6CDBB|nr:RHS repeat-associated core domain-containing protein [Leifsonia sp. AK011]NYF11357.1 RHS repeat-associated protein [Leifsonia sp. AK011]
MATPASGAPPKLQEDISVPGTTAGPIAEAPTPESSISVLTEKVELPDGETAVIELTSEPAPLGSAAARATAGDEEPTPEVTGSPIEGTPGADTEPEPTETPSVEEPEESAPSATPEPTETAEPEQEPDVSAQWEEIGDSGISLSLAPSNVAARGTAPTSPSIEATILSDDEREKLGLSGLAIALVREDSDASTDVMLRVPDSLIDGLYGADYASRVRWRVADLPASATSLTSRSSTQSVQRATPADTEIDDENAYITASVSSEPLIVFAAASASSSSGAGDFSATSLKSSSSWDVSAQTGAFSWTYPMEAPPSPAGMKPQVSLSYNSQSVDGKTSAANNQTSFVGEGWDLSGLGFIERSYVTCSKDDVDPINGSGDQCWKMENATVSFGSMSGPLVKDATNGWHLETDENVRVDQLFECVSGSDNNGTTNDECWRLTSTDGTQYYFGKHRLPGWSSGKPETKSAWAVPVIGNTPGEPCDNGTVTLCMRGWRWNLDYVVDVSGNAMVIYYNAEKNRYKLNGGTPVDYTRGGSPNRIEYGMRSSDIYTTNAPTGIVQFQYDANGRCNGTGADCSPQAVDGLVASPSDPSKYPDVPYDQNCISGTCTGLTTPSFFTTAKLKTVLTKAFVVDSSPAYDTVDKWDFNHSFPDPGDGSPSLWLTDATHTGYSGSTALAEPAIQFAGITKQNRVWVTSSGVAPLNKYRLNDVTLETGAKISVTYNDYDCKPFEAATLLANVHNNSRLCFPQTWNPETDYPVAPRKDLFHKFVVTSTTAWPETGGAGSPSLETYYDYSAGTPAWRYNDNPFTPEDYRTWSEYAGYDKVEIRVGANSNPSKQETTQYWFYRGLDGDRAAPAGGTKSVSVTDFPGVTDSKWLAGRTYQSKVLNGDGGTVASTTVTTPWDSGVRASDGYRQARTVRDAVVTVTEPLANGTSRVTSTTSTYDSRGFTLNVSKANEAGAVSTCTEYQYVPDNASAWIVGLTKQEITREGVCSTTPTYPQDHISGIRHYYDSILDTSYGSAPTLGRELRTDELTSYDPTTLAPVWTKVGTKSFDTRGRVVSTVDRRGRETTSTYTPSAGAAAASGGLKTTSVTNVAMGWTTTTDYDTTRGNILAVTDKNGLKQTAEYDPLGRTLRVWGNDRPKASNPIPSVAFAYVQAPLTPLSVATTALTSSTTSTSYTIFDGLGRQVQTQSPSPNGGTIISDTAYDSAGRVISTHAPYWNQTLVPSGLIHVPSSPTLIPSRTENTYDGLGRVTQQKLVSLGTTQSTTSTTYLGADRVDVTPPSGGTPTTSISNSLGQQTSLTQYLGSAPGPSVPQVTTTYGYGVQGQMTSMTDANGNDWTWTYDTVGQLVASSDPDSGTRTTEYDNVGRKIAATDSRGETIRTVYDDADRVKEVWEDSVTTGTLLSSYVYDTLYKGQLSSVSSYVASTSELAHDPYVYTVNSYDTGYRPTQTTVSIPSSAPAFGGFSYTESTSYLRDGTVNTISMPAVGGLGAENLRTYYNSQGMPNLLRGTGGATVNYISTIGYTATGLPQQFKRDATVDVTTDLGYDPATRLLSQIRDYKMVSGSVFDYSNRIYTRNQVGSITSSSVTANGVANSHECFQYDYLQNLTQAWTANALSCSSAPTETTIGSAAPYWKSWTVDPVTGNRTQMVDHPTSSSDVETTDAYTYPTTGDQPHTVDLVSTSVDGVHASAEDFTFDDAGNMVARDGLTFSYDAMNRLERIETSGLEEQDNVYSANGQLLLRHDSVEGTTLYLGSTELHVPAGSTTVSALRTYSIAGQTVAEREATAGVSGFTLRWLSMDVVGTSKVSIDATTGVAIRRNTDPFGVGTNPNILTTPWPTSHGYLNSPESQTTGLTRLGAREYDPELGKFISLDPVLSPFNPQQNNGYSYANNSPVASADATGYCSALIQFGARQCPTGTKPNKDGTGFEYKHDTPPPPGETESGTGSGDSSGGDPQWFNPFTWSGDTWQDMGAMVAGIAVTVAITAAVIGAVGCTAVTFGVCGAVIIGVGVAAGAIGAAVTYGLQSGEKSAEGLGQSMLLGGLGGLVPGAGAVLGKVLTTAGKPVAAAVVTAVTGAASKPAFTAGGAGIKSGTNAIQSVAASASKGPVGKDLFRYVSQPELDDIASNGFREGGNSLGGKFFAESAEDAANWGAKMGPEGGSIVRVEAPDDFVSSLQSWDNLDGIGPARYVEPERFPELNQFPWSVSK